MYDLLVDLTMREGWRFTITVHGEQFVIMVGTETMFVLSADSLVIKMPRLRSVVVDLIVGLEIFGLTMLNVQVMSHRYFRADIEEWEFTAVVTMKTRGYAVQEDVEVRINDENLNIFMNGIFNLFVRYL